MNYETFIDCLKSNANIFRILNCKLKPGQAKYLENDDDFNKYLKEQVITDLKELLLGIKDHHLRYGMDRVSKDTAIEAQNMYNYIVDFNSIETYHLRLFLNKTKLK